jgi:TonB family protein
MIAHTITFLNDHASAWLAFLAAFELQLLLLGAAALLLDTLLVKASPKYRYLVWCLVLAKAFLPPMIPVPLPAVPGILPAMQIKHAPSLPAPMSQTIAPPYPADLPVAPGTTTPFFPPATLPSLSWEAAVVLLLAALSSLLLAVFLYQRMAVRRRLARAVPLAPEHPEQWARAGYPSVFMMEGIDSPCVVGARRPRLVIPSSFPAADIRPDNPILLHELTHLRRRDGWMLLAQSLGQILHPLNPMLWLANLRLARYREQLCDREAMRRSGVAAHDYGAMLMAWIERRPLQARALRADNHFFETRRGMMDRFRAILRSTETDMKHSSRFRYTLIGGLAILLAASLGTCSRQESDQKKARANNAAAGQEYGGSTWIEDDIGDVTVEGACEVKPVFNIPWFMNFDTRRLSDTIADGVRRTLQVSADVDTGGNLTNVKVAPCGNIMLEGLVARAFTRTRCTPAKKGGAAVPVRIGVPVYLMMYHFRLGHTADHESALLKESLKRDFDTEPTPVNGMDALIASVEYPPIARKASIEGTVTAMVRISATGSVEETGINMSKYEVFEAPAIEAIRKAAWKPAMKNGRPVAATISVHFRFVIPLSYDVKPKPSQSEGCAAPKAGKK